MRIAIGIRVFIFSLRGSLGVFAPVPALPLILQCKLSVNCVHLLEICVLFSAGWLCVSFQAGYGAHLSAAAWVFEMFSVFHKTWKRFARLCATKVLIIGPTSEAGPALVVPGAVGRVRMSNALNGEGILGAGDDMDYRPSEDEPFMNPRQIAYFRRKLLNWKEEILREAQDTLVTLQNEPLREPDLTDRASSETDWSIELRTRDRQRKLIAKIDSALRRIDEGEYGYCEVTGEPISLGRLEARPIATMTVEAQSAHERNEKISRDE